MSKDKGLPQGKTLPKGWKEVELGELLSDEQLKVVLGYFRSGEQRKMREFLDGLKG